MPKLSLALLGPCHVTLDGEAISGLTSDRARALLVYLAVEADRAHLRGALAELLWPEHREESALDNLRHALAQLRRAIGDQQAPPYFLLAVRDTLQFDRSSDHWLDVAAFRSLLAADEAGRADVEGVERAMALYRGEFLAGFPTGDSPAFDDWVAFHRGHLSSQALLALQCLAVAHQSRGDHARAEGCFRRQLSIEPWREEAHRELMRILAFSDQRSAALAQFDACKRALKDGLDVEPDRETVALYQRIRDGNLQPPAVSYRIPVPTYHSSLLTHHFVARERELAWLDGQLEAARAGRGRVAFVMGEAGSGKTALLSEFARRAMQSQGDLVVAAGSSNAQTGLGDPYLPFREALQMLASDVEAKRAGESLSADHAHRLWALLPDMLQALVESGPDLVDLLVPGQPLLARAQALSATASNSASLARLEKLLQRRPPRPGSALQQTDLFEQVTRVLHQLARRQTLVVVLDDLQWADRGSIALLFHLGRRLAEGRILVLGAYRPCEVVEGRGGEMHPLEPVLHELAREFGEVLLDMDQAEGRRFVEELLDTEPNRLGEGFRERLYRHTAGHALFTVELLRGLQERGDLMKDESGRWVEGPHLDWQRLPARVEAVIAGRVSRLPAALRATLRVASVEGEEFTAEVVATVQDVEAREVYRHLSGPLSREHGLVVARSLERLGEHRRSRYRFRHHLFQRYLYNQLDEVERARLHEEVGTALEAMYGDMAASEKAVELAQHFEAAGLVPKAVGYLLDAGNNALRLCGWTEARGHFERGLSLLGAMPDSLERDRREVDLQLALGSVLLATDGFGSRSQIAAYARAYDLSRKLGERVQLWPALHALANSSTARGDYPKALELGEQLLELAQRSGKSWLLALAHFTLGATLFSSGISLIRSREHLEQAILFYEREPDPERCCFLTSLNTFDVGVNSRAWLATVLWILGYPDQAVTRSQEALASAQQLDHFLSLVLALYAAGHAYQHRWEDQALGECVQQLQRLVSGKHLLVGDVWVEVFGGWLMVREGQLEEGLRRIREGTAAWQKTGAVFGTTAQLIVLTEACMLSGQIEEGLEVVAKALALVERTGARSNEADLYWLRGELLLAGDGDVAEAEAWFRKTMDVASGQEARSYQLRAATSLARLWARQGRQKEARELLSPVYNWFTEGFDTPDLVDARRLLAEL